MGQDWGGRWRTHPVRPPTGGHAPALPPLVFTPRRLFILGLVVALIVSYIGPVRGYRHHQAELRVQEQQLRDLTRQRDTIRAELAKSNTPAAIEARARELGYIKPGEVQYRITDLERPADAERARGDVGIWNWFPTVA